MGATMGLPPHFCWTKYGTEAGETSASILQRKEQERADNGGIFLWGIGNSIRPSLLELRAVEERPHTVFTPMLSRPVPRDTAPAATGSWTRAVGPDGTPWELPRYTLVTSGVGHGQPAPQRHFALVCERLDPLASADEGWLDDNELRNLRSGAVVGPSQVTSVVRRIAVRHRRNRYKISFRARLVYPYLVTLTGWCPIEPTHQSALESSDQLVPTGT
jgi:hypothetical protein